MKAYKNQEFINSPEARTLRMLAEYLEPQDRLAKRGVHKAVIFWGSARLRPGGCCGPDAVDYYTAARELAARLAHWTTERHGAEDRYYICTGGGPGIMEAANRGASEVNPSLSVGLNISLPHEQAPNDFISPGLSFEFHYFFMRKFWFLNLARGMAIFPGGFGTMDELFEVLTLVQTGKKEPIPVLLFGKSFWTQLVRFELFVEQGLIVREDLDRIYMTDSLDEGFRYLTRGLEAHEN
jgi:uncharacterized protein (TIGR00730 family)